MLRLTTALALSALLWRDRLNPALAPLPPKPTVQQQRFGMNVSPAMLARLERRIADHEAVAGARLTADERRSLRALLHKLVYG